MNDQSTASSVQTLRSWITSSCEVLSIILNQGVYPEPGETAILPAAQLPQKEWKGLCFPVGLLTGVEGELYMLFTNEQASTLLDLLVGGTGIDPKEGLIKEHLGVLQEALQQVVSGLADMLTRVLDKSVKVQLSPAIETMPVHLESPEYLWVEFPLSLDEGPPLGLTLLLDAKVADQLTPPPAVQTHRPTPSEKTKAFPEIGRDSNKQEKHRFQVLEPAKQSQRREQLDLILDVPLQVQVVLGRTSLLVQDLIHLGEGSILELDKLAGEPVELYIKDRLVALGEVIVVDERFGVKVLELAEHRKTHRPLAS